MGEYADMMIDGDFRRLARFAEAHDRAMNRKAASDQRRRAMSIINCPSADKRLGININANGAHWQGRLDGKVIAEWWPGTGRLVVLGRHKEKKEFIHDAVLFAHVCVVIAEGG